MKAVFSKIWAFAKAEAVLTVAAVLALASAFVVPPDKKYLDYIDFDTLLLLFALMAVMAGCQKLGVFSRIGNRLLSSIRSRRVMLLALVFLPFFFSMLITNDVALITFVPFGLIVLKLARQERLAVPLVVMQTVAANLGSMLTPMGNPQNLYLFAQSGLPLGEFLLIVLPYALVSALALLAAAFFTKNEPIEFAPASSDALSPSDKKRLAAYAALFAVCLASVAKLLPPWASALVVAAAFLLLDRSVFRKVDYALLGTFVGFFIFVGNMGRIESLRALLDELLVGREQAVAILASQVISNVPAALLLSGFTENYRALIVGTNLGGLGTLIASMASLISYKQVCREYPRLRGRYLLVFTAANIAMLLLLVLFDAGWARLVG